MKRLSAPCQTSPVVVGYTERVPTDQSLHYLNFTDDEVGRRMDGCGRLLDILFSHISNCTMSKPPIFYPTNMKISYKNDIEYRKVIRNLFKMTCNVLSMTGEDQEEIDEITQDEWNYDSESATPFMDFIYDSTREIPIFQEFYKKSAGFMLSEEAGIGLAILFSYDYLESFHHVLCDYFTYIDGKGSVFDDQLPSVIELRQKLTR